MAHRFCPRCNAHVEDAGGYCLLGHPLVEHDSSLDHLRAEVDKAFEDARLEVAEALASVTAPEPELVGAMVGAPPPPAAATAAGSQPRPRRMPPPPPPPTRSDEGLAASFGAPLAEDDPIAAFAPPPRMDWGPERMKVLRRNPFKRQKAAATA
jgi:hypothetical protein